MKMSETGEGSHTRLPAGIRSGATLLGLETTNEIYPSQKLLANGCPGNLRGEAYPKMDYACPVTEQTIAGHRATKVLLALAAFESMRSLPMDSWWTTMGFD